MMKSFTIRSAAAALALLVALPACQQSMSSGAASTSAAAPDGARQIRYRGDFDAPMGVQLYSFREMAKTDPVGMLNMTRKMGITHVETAGMYNMSADKLAQTFKTVGLRPTSMHVSVDDFRNKPDEVIANAKALGVKYVGTAWYPHTGGFKEADARKAIADFNQFGRAMKNAGLTFFYHNHGYEPVPYGDGTLLDLIIRETDPELVKFEMDVLWTFLPGVDPTALLKKYPGRFKLMHIKDMKTGLPRGSLSGGLPDAGKSVIGEGQVNWAELMKAAKKDGMEHYYLEDESLDPIGNVPKSITYLEGLKF